MLDIDRFRQTELVPEPFEHLVVPNFVDAEALSRINADFPDIRKGGSFPVASLDYGPAFGELVEALEGEPLRAAFEEKFGMDLSGRPTTLTVRGHTRAKDGRIHTDSKTKLITVLLYLEESWPADGGGRLRLLRSSDDLDDAITEVKPAGGALVAFRCRENAYHGHTRHVGRRRSMQLNWVTDASAAQQTNRRHRLSHAVKKLNPFK